MTIEHTIIKAMIRSFDLSSTRNDESFHRKQAQIAIELGRVGTLMGSSYRNKLNQIGEETLRTYRQDLMESLQKAVQAYGVPDEHQQIKDVVRIKLGKCAAWIDREIKKTYRATGAEEIGGWDIQTGSVIREAVAKVDIFIQKEKPKEPTGIKGFWLKHWKFLTTLIVSSILAIIGLIIQYLKS